MVSSTNRTQLEDLLKRSKPDLQPQDYVELVDPPGECPLREEDLVVLCGHLEAPKAKKAASRKGEKLSQGYINFHLYMNGKIQDAFLGGSWEADALQCLLFKYLKIMGLEKGDEPTYKRMNSFFYLPTPKTRRKLII